MIIENTVKHINEMTDNYTDKVTAVIPTYNEACNLDQLFSQLFELNLPNFGIIIIDDNSPDDTAKIAQNLSSQYGGKIEVIVRPQKAGLGTAYKHGFKRAVETGSKYLIQLDADLSHPISEIPIMLEKLKKVDVVVGSRYSSSFWNFNAETKWPMRRRLLSSLGNLAIRMVSGIEVHDTTSGFKAINHNVIHNIKLEDFVCKGFGFQAEMAFKSQYKGYKTIEHPITFVNRTKGNSKMSLSIIAESILVLLCLRINQIKKRLFLNRNFKNRIFSD